MKVIRKVVIDQNFNKIKVGDQIKVLLKDFGSFTATAQKVTEDNIIFLFDECIAEKEMNKDRTNCDGVEGSTLYKWLQETVLQAFPDDIKKHIINLSLPTYGMMFGHDEWYNAVLEPDNDEQFELMKIRKNRVFDYKNDYEWYWLANVTKKDVSATNFAYVGGSGDAAYVIAAGSSGVLPVFVYKK